MRDIKFRAFHKKRKKFYKVLHLHIANIMNGGGWATCEGLNVIEQKEIHIQIQPDDCIVVQFTGRRDKNGKEIYEGDILKSESTQRLYLVVFRKKLCQFIGVGGQVVFSPYFWEKEAEVIGNIHENPELLEEKP